MGVVAIANCLSCCCAVLVLLVQFVEELGKLQDRVPAFSADKAEAIIEQDLGQPVSQVMNSRELTGALTMC
jgi:hypothetical protein